MAEFHLHCFAQSGNAYKPALMLALAQADWQAVFVDYFNAAHKSAAFRRLNPMGEVPVLQHGDLTLTQSGAILDYLADQLGQFGGQNETERREILRWLLFDNHKLTNYCATLRYLRRFAGHAEDAVTAFFEVRAIAALKVLNRHLQHRAFVLGERMSIADISLCGYLFYDDELGFALSEFESVNAWLNRIRCRPHWQHPYQLMPGHQF